MSRPTCEACGSHPVERQRRRIGEGYYYGKICSSCRKRPWVRDKKDHCEVCGFVAENRVQLDVDHVDGDHSNNAPENLQTICANCHRLRSYKEKHYKSRKHRGLE